MAMAILLELEDAGRKRRRWREWCLHRRECIGQLCGELKSFGTKKIDMDGQIFILLKLSATILDENHC
jgi:hypothetical protein